MRGEGAGLQEVEEAEELVHAVLEGSTRQQDTVLLCVYMCVCVHVVGIS